MARQKKPVHRVQMTDGKRNIIRQLLEEYDIETAEDIKDSLKDLLGGTIKEIFMWILVFCMLFNGGTVPWYITMRSYHLMDSIWGLVLGTGLQVFNVILAVNFFKNLPSELEEACFVDGGGPWRNLISIYIPLAKPMVATIALFTMVMYWNEFFQGMVLSTRQSSYPLQTYIQQMVVTLDYSTMNVEQIEQAIKLNNLSLDAAKIFIAMIPVLIVYPFLQRYFVGGITLGSVKG